MEALYGYAYLAFLAIAVFFTAVRRESMVYLIWPVIFLYPYAWVRSILAFYVLGVHDMYVLGCGILLLADIRRTREGLALAEGTVRALLLLMSVLVLVHFWGAGVFLMRYPQENLLMPIRSLTSDLRMFVPLLIAVTYIRNDRQIRRAMLVFTLSIFAAFLLVVLDRFGSSVYVLFNHTTYQSTVAMHHYRAVGGFGGPWEVGAVGASAMILLLYLSIAGLHLDRILGIVTVVVVGVGISFSLSRSGILSALFGVAAVLVLSGTRMRLRGIFVIGIVAIVLANVRFGDEDHQGDLPSLVGDRMGSAYQEGEFSGTAESRVDIWKSQIDHLLSNRMSWAEILFGIGGIDGSVRLFNASSHSGFIGPIFYYGLVGALLMEGLWLYLLIRGLRLWLRRSSPQILVLLGAATIGMVGNEFLSSLTATSVLGWAVAILSLIAGIKARQGTESGRTPPVTGASRPAGHALPMPDRTRVRSL